jgi:serpin B
MRVRLGYLLCLCLTITITAGSTVLAGPPEKPSADESALARANNQFALSLYQSLAGEEQNLFFSPTSLSSLLTMTHAGARGETGDQMAKVLHLGELEPRVHTVLGSFLRAIDNQARRKGDRLEFASALWSQKGETILPAFQAVLRRDYESDLHEVDFQDSAVASRTINDWVAKQTHGRIPELTSPGGIESQARLILVNAIFFKGAWASPFLKDHTWGETFHTPAGSKESVPFMHQSTSFLTGKTKNFNCSSCLTRMAPS